MNEATNTLFINGKLLDNPAYHHEMAGERFYTATVSVTRLSGKEDHLPVTIPELFVRKADLRAGAPVCFEGQIRTYNKVLDGANRLLLTCFVLKLRDPETTDNPNWVNLFGTICKPPQYRVTPFGREITDMMIAVNMPFGKSAYIPCIAWGFTARKYAHLKVGDRVSIEGRVQSREYDKPTPDGSLITKTTYEVSVIRMHKAPAQSVIDEFEEVRNCV